MISYQQKADHTCGAACVRTVMARFGKRVLTEKALARKLKAKFATGIEPWAIVDYLRAEGLSAEYKEEKNFATLHRRMDANPKELAIVCWADWGGHYCVIVEHKHVPFVHAGRIEIQVRLALADPAALYDFRVEGFTFVSDDRFKSMWFTPGTKRKREVIYVRENDPPLR